MTIAEVPKKKGVLAQLKGKIYKAFVSGENPNVKYEIPDKLYHRIPQAEGNSILISGPKKDLTVTLETPAGSVNLKDLAPPNTRFFVGRNIVNSLTPTIADTDTGEIEISAGKKNQKLLTYSLIKW